MNNPESISKEHDGLSAIERLKFPRIRHIFDESARTRDDLLVTPEERTSFLKEFNEGLGVLTEKIDGLNIGIGFDQQEHLRIRHRNELGNGEENILYVGASNWAQQRFGLLKELLKTDAVLFVEWMEWRHTVQYDNLSDYAQIIALYDAKEGRFMSYNYINDLFNSSGIALVPQIPMDRPIETVSDCLSMISGSHFSTTAKMEGLVLRVDDGAYNKTITKFVHPDFRAAVDNSEHWVNKKLLRNKINYQLQAKLLNI